MGGTQERPTFELTKETLALLGKLHKELPDDLEGREINLGRLKVRLSIQGLKGSLNRAIISSTPVRGRLQEDVEDHPYTLVCRLDGTVCRLIQGSREGFEKLFRVLQVRDFVKQVLLQLEAELKVKRVQLSQAEVELLNGLPEGQGERVKLGSTTMNVSRTTFEVEGAIGFTISPVFKGGFQEPLSFHYLPDGNCYLHGEGAWPGVKRFLKALAEERLRH